MGAAGTGGNGSPDVADAAGAWRAAVVENLTRGGPVCQHAARYILAYDIAIGFARQGTEAKWSLRGKVELNSQRYSLGSNPRSPRLLGSVVHEAKHVEQGAALALSVEGEVGAWKAEYRARAELNAPLRNPLWEAVALTSDCPTDEELRLARSNMLEMTGHRYLIWLLPLRPNFWSRLVGRFQRAVSLRRPGGA